MKTGLLILVLVINLALAGNSFAARHGNSVDQDNFQPEQPAVVIASIGEYADKETIEALKQKLEDPDPFVRVEAVQSLGEIHMEQSVESVCKCLKDENLYVRAYAAEALGKIGGADLSLALLSLLAALDDPSPYVRAMMVSALGELQDERAIDSIKILLHDEDESVRTMAEWALGNIENSF
jgi:HEAT repeat protein